MHAARVAGVILGLTFTASGALKLTSKGWKSQAAAFGAPRVVIPFVAPAELAAGALLAATGSPAIAWFILAMLAAFTPLLIHHLRADDRPVCACFGALSSGPVSWWSVGRNAVLAALAMVAALA